MFNLKIAEELQIPWQTQSIKQLDLYLSPLKSKFSHLTLHFFGEPRHQQKKVFCCRLRLALSSNDIREVNTRHCDGNIALTDALARARRIVIRNQQLVLTRPNQKQWQSPAKKNSFSPLR